MTNKNLINQQVGKRKKINDSPLAKDFPTLGVGLHVTYQNELMPLAFSEIPDEKLSQYTNPIRMVGVEYLSTKLNNQGMLDLADGTIPGFPEDRKKWAKEAYDKLEAHLG